MDANYYAHVITRKINSGSMKNFIETKRQWALTHETDGIITSKQAGVSFLY
jgi:hypothetical protein